MKETEKSHSLYSRFNGYFLMNAVNVRQRFGFPWNEKIMEFFRHSSFL